MNELLKKSATEQRKALLNKEVSAMELVNAAYERIDEVEDRVKAFNSLTKEIALETAKKVDEKIAHNEELPLLAGIPLVLKDNMNLVGSKTTASSKILENFSNFSQKKNRPGAVLFIYLTTTFSLLASSLNTILS